MDEIIILGMVIAIIVLFYRIGKLNTKTDELQDALRLIRQRLNSDGITEPDIPNQPAKTGQRVPVDKSLWPNWRDQAPVSPLETVPAERITAPQPADATDDVTKDIKGDPLGPDFDVPPIAALANTTPAGPPDPALGDRVGAWLKDNWFYAISAVCLALAGVFLIHYGVERGLLTPLARVSAAAALGVLLVIGGEVIRRRSGDQATSHTAYLPSTLSGAGVIVMVTAILGARYLYGMIGAEPAFAMLLALFGGTVLLGWLYGPVLTAIGLVGATITPFIVGGSSDQPEFFFYYFALIALTGLLIDTIKQWLWPSMLGLIVTYAAATLLFLGAGGVPHFLAFALIVMLGSLIIPHRQLSPAHDGPMLTEVMNAFEPKSLKPPVMIGVGATLAGFAAVALTGLIDTGLTEIVTSLVMLVIMQLLVMVWCRNAPALTDLNLAAPIVLLALLADQGLHDGSLLRHYQELLAREEFGAAQLLVLLLSGLGLLGSALAFWRGYRADRFALPWAYAVALYAPLVLLVLEVCWRPATTLGEAEWGSVSLVVAAVFTLFAERLARIDGHDRRRVAIMAIAAVGMLSFALTIILSEVALTIALALTVALAVFADRRFDLPPLSLFAQLGVIFVSFRLVFVPGIDWAIEVPLAELLTTFTVCYAPLVVAWHWLGLSGRQAARTVTESVLLSLPAVLVIVLLYRGLDGEVQNHGGQALFAITFMVTCFAQLYRLPVSVGWMWRLRATLAALFGGLASIYLIAAVWPFNPVVNNREVVAGPYILDTLFVAYALPALLLVASTKVLSVMEEGWRRACYGVSAVLLMLYVGLETRRLWRGDVLSVAGVSEPELYSYTVLLLIASTTLLILAYFRRSVDLYRLAMVAVAITLAKAFLIDMAGLEGLLRVASFLGLGLVLAGLAWLNNQIRPRLRLTAETPAVP